ncbi:MAG: flavin monoamine oxidase family protein [Gemmatimonadales bacterium]
MTAPSFDADVLILGAGAAGLAAARDLSHAGLRVIVVEGRDRLGGRILTVHDPRAPVPLELGAEFVHGVAPATFAVAAAARLMVVELPDTHEVASRGRLRLLPDFWQTLEAMHRDVARRVSRRRGDFPVSEYLRSASMPAQRRALLQDFVEGYHAAHPERLSARAFAAAAAEAGDPAARRQFRIASGGDALVQWLRDGLDPERSEVRLSTIAEVLEWRRGAVRLAARTALGHGTAPLAARVAVVTLPHAVLRAGALRFVPALAAKQRALDRLETGQIFKIVLRFRRAFWQDDAFLRARRGARGRRAAGTSAALHFLHAPGAALPTWWTALPAQAPVLTGWVGGAKAEALLAREPDVRLHQALTALAVALGVSRSLVERELDAWVSHDWRSDVFSRGAYTYPAVGGAAAPRALARPVEQTIFFAGEATDGDQIGTVAGALDSGHRAAREAAYVLRH